ncbi:FlgD immunoglobulin-like domain containing protein [Desulforegula conservatrix]|uniref:FlgD immunoglobulin-like domain containing protein n=1 Tax=Desulforegula conservatrix TaxID=153026 RepID=UPI00040A4E91|nr:FlgD immunoglobulin-like domain containing protein [Desulforegula conservatrix]
MTTTSSSSAINNISSQYTARKTDEDPLGKEAFLTMLIAQLKNQDPLNPMDGTDFTAQLAQFTQLEKTMNMDSTLTKMLESMNGTDSKDYVGYIGKTITGNLNTMSVSDGEATTGYFSMAQAGEAVVAVYDSSGTEIKRIYLGQQNAGTNSFSWDGKDTDDKIVADGNYSYDVFVLGDNGYSKLDTSVKGQVTGVTYKNGKQYMEVVPTGSTKTVLLDPSTIGSVGTSDTTTNTSTSDYVNHIGKTVTGQTGEVLVSSGVATEGYFTLKNSESEVLVSIQDPSGKEIRRINLGSLGSGVHEIGWDVKDSDGNTAANGSYDFKILVKDSTGYSSIDPVLTGEVTGVTYEDGYPYLQVSTGSGSVLMNPGAVRQIKES